jgi:hypothetical protein
MNDEDRERKKGVYITLETVGYEKKATELPMLIIRKWMNQYLTGTEEGKTMRDGKILFLAKDEQTAQKTENNCKTLYDICNLKIQRMDRMNESQGTIFSRSMPSEKEEDILEALKAYRCTKVERMEQYRDGQRKPNGSHILTFVARELPENVLCGYERYAVKRYCPNPLRCGVCCQFGHKKTGVQEKRAHYVENALHRCILEYVRSRRNA